MLHSWYVCIHWEQLWTSCRSCTNIHSSSAGIQLHMKHTKCVFHIRQTYRSTCTYMFSIQVLERWARCLYCIYGSAFHPGDKLMSPQICSLMSLDLFYRDMSSVQHAMRLRSYLREGEGVGVGLGMPIQEEFPLLRLWRNTLQTQLGSLQQECPHTGRRCCICACELIECTDHSNASKPDIWYGAFTANPSTTPPTSDTSWNWVYNHSHCMHAALTCPCLDVVLQAKLTAEALMK